WTRSSAFMISTRLSLFGASVTADDLEDAIKTGERQRALHGLVLRPDQLDVAAVHAAAAQQRHQHGHAGAVHEGRCRQVDDKLVDTLVHVLFQATLELRCAADIQPLLERDRDRTLNLFLDIQFHSITSKECLQNAMLPAPANRSLLRWAIV